MGALIFFFILFFLGLGTSCQRPRVSTPGPAIPVAHPEALFDALKVRAEGLHSLKAIAKIKYSSPRQKFTVSQAVLARKPSFLRLEALGPFGQTVHLLVTDGQRLTLYWPQEKKAYIGRASYENIARFLPLGLNKDELVSLFFAEASARWQKPNSVSWVERDGLYLLTFLSPFGAIKELWWVDPRGPVLAKREVYDPGLGLVFQALMSDFQSFGEVLFPRRIELSFPGQIKIELTYQEIRLNADINESLFSFSVPTDGEVVILDEAP